jgi:hypothetical protein
MTEREWQRLERTKRFIVLQQKAIERNFAAADRRFARAEGRLEQAERRMDRMERYADRIIKRGERRMLQAEAERADLREILRQQWREIVILASCRDSFLPNPVRTQQPEDGFSAAGLSLTAPRVP